MWDEIVGAQSCQEKTRGVEESKKKTCQRFEGKDRKKPRRGRPRETHTHTPPHLGYLRSAGIV